MTAQIIELIICHTCQDKLGRKKPHKVWEGSVYCEPCYDKYLILMGDWLKQQPEESLKEVENVGIKHPSIFKKNSLK